MKASTSETLPMGIEGKNETLASLLSVNGDKLKQVLMIAYVFPPFFSTGGSIRVVKFIKYLPEHGWLPVVLTIDDSQEYDTQRKLGSEELLQDIPGQVKIYRTFAGEPTAEFLEKGREVRQKNRLAAVIISLLRTARNWARRYLLLPDENITWMPFALRMGRQIARNESTEIIFATCPPHSVALIGATLKRLTGKPLVLDFRDDWIDTPWHRSKPWLIRQIEQWLEKRTVKTADRVILVTEWSRNAFLNRYPNEPKDKFEFIPNGCDLVDFDVLKHHPRLREDSKFTIVHAGLLSETDEWRRSPKAFFEALHHIRQHHPGFAGKLNVIFTGQLPEGYRRLVETLDLTSVVNEVGHLPPEKFLHQMKNADLLLAINYDDLPTLIPGKLYEYWAIGGPPILLLSCCGAAKDLVEKKELGITVPPYDVEAIQQALLNIYLRREKGKPLQVKMLGIEDYDRKSLTEKLALTFSSLDNI